jgi:HlyD family secretion protein
MTLSLSNLAKSPQSRWWGLAITSTAIVGGLTLYGVNALNQAKTAQLPPATAPAVTQITALGRLEPMGEVVQLAAPVALDGDRLLELRVKEGSRVTAGQVIAVLESRNRLADAVAQAEEQVRLAQAKLAQVRAGAKTGAIQAQQAAMLRLQAELEGAKSVQAATIARLQAEYRNAQTEYARFQRLYREGAIAANELDGKRLAMVTAQQELQEARAAQNRTAATLAAQLKEASATLNQVQEVRPVDVQTAQVEVDDALARLRQAKTNLAEAYIRSPINAQVLKIHTRPGEKLNSEGIVELGQTSTMTVVAEVYQTDIGRVRLGQPVKISGQAFPGTLVGSVSQIGVQVSRQNVFGNQPGENLDRRVVEVRIALSPQASQQVANLTNLQVQVVIQP